MIIKKIDISLRMIYQKYRIIKVAITEGNKKKENSCYELRISIDEC